MSEKQDSPSISNEVINERYRLLKEIGRGSFGTVHVGYDLSLKREVAVKMLNSDVREEEVNVDRFLDEARLTGSLSDPNILTLYDCGQDQNGRLFLVTELLKGESLEQVIKRGDELDPTFLLDLFIPLTKALQHAHDHGVVHRDIKPGNLFLTKVRGEPILKLLDFGIAKSHQNLTMTMTGHILGSPAYMSPEQALGDLEITPSADLYSLGVSLYHCLTGHLPYEADTILGMLNAVVKSSPTPVADLTEDENRQKFQLFFDQALEKLPHHRFASATHMGKALYTIRKKLTNDQTTDSSEIALSQESVSAETAVLFSPSDSASAMPEVKTPIIPEGAFPADLDESRFPKSIVALILLTACSVGAYHFEPRVRELIDLGIAQANTEISKIFSQRVPSKVELILLPQKLTYQIGDIVELKMKVIDEFGDEIEESALHEYKPIFTSDHPRIKIIGNMMNLLGTGTTMVRTCLKPQVQTSIQVDPKRLKESLCQQVEIKTTDELLPF